MVEKIDLANGECNYYGIIRNLWRGGGWEYFKQLPEAGIWNWYMVYEKKMGNL